MKNRKLLETIADIAYLAGQKHIYTGDSRADASTFIFWAEQFERKHKDTCWDEEDYILMIEKFTSEKINTELIGCKVSTHPWFSFERSGNEGL